MPLNVLFHATFWLAASAATAVFWAAPARSEIRLSDLVVELQSGPQTRADIEIWNSGQQRTYIVLEPKEIIAAGTEKEVRHSEPDPEKFGLLVAPTRMILEPGQRRIVRIAAIGQSEDEERIFRVTTRPVAGELSSEHPGIKLLVGYDVLVLLRPAKLQPGLEATRADGRLTFRNTGNVSLELIDGRQCSLADNNQRCRSLPGKRLYSGGEWTLAVPETDPVEYVVKSPKGSVRKRY